jgi:quercetin dioxygenase-like cupin family protein
MNKINVPGCKDTFVQEISSDGKVQVMNVEVEKKEMMPFHSHDCAATMIITEGAATALGRKKRSVKQGDIVIRKRNARHGFSDIKNTFSSISLSDGHGIMSNHEKSGDRNYI